MTQLKSLAHHDWPYAGTAHEWRGFVKSDSKVVPCPEFVWLAELLFGPAGPIPPYPTTAVPDYAEEQAIYQKQNFGPELK